MTARDLPRPPEPALRCDHCGRAVQETQHTRTDYRVDYYSLHSGHGEVCAVPGDERQRGGSYVKLLDRFDIVTCAQCYHRDTVRAERERRFHPERDASSEAETA